MGRTDTLRHGAGRPRFDESRSAERRLSLEPARQRPRYLRRRLLDGRNRDYERQVQAVRILGPRLHYPRTPCRPGIRRQRGFQDRRRQRRKPGDPAPQLEQSHTLAQSQRGRTARHRERVPHKPHHRRARTRCNPDELPLRNLQPHRSRTPPQPSGRTPTRIQHRPTRALDPAYDFKGHGLRERGR